MRKYVTKDNNFIQWGMDINKGSHWKNAVELAQGGNIDEAKRTIYENDPRSYVLYGHSINKNLTEMSDKTVEINAPDPSWVFRQPNGIHK